MQDSLDKFLSGIDGRVLLRYLMLLRSSVFCFKQMLKHLAKGTSDWLAVQGSLKRKRIKMFLNLRGKGEARNRLEFPAKEVINSSTDGLNHSRSVR
jgi:hypothetical protein